MPLKEDTELMPSTLETIDTAFYNWVNETLDISATSNRGWNKVPLIWVSAERSFQVKNDKDLRDEFGVSQSRSAAGDITKETIADPTLRNLLLPRQRGLSPGTLPGFLTSFGLNLASATPTGTGFGGLAATAAKAAQQPFQTFQAAKLTDREDRADLAKDLFTSAVASEYDVAVQKLKNQAETGSDLSVAETERNIITNAQEEIFKQRDILENDKSTDEEKKAAERAIIVQQKVLEKELGVPAE